MNRRLIGILSLVFLALSLVGCGQKGNQAAAAAAGPPAPRVKTVKATPQPVGQYTEYIATLKSRTSSDIRPEVEGQITRIMVQSGDRVEPGTPLLEIDPRKQEATLNSQEATRRSRTANLEWAHTQLLRTKQLAAAGVISKQELDQAQMQYESAKADVDALEATVREQRVQLRYYAVNAPSIGVVGDIPVRVGDRVTNATVLTTIDKGGELEAYISVPAEKAGSIKLGTPVEMVDETGKTVLKTKISFVSPRVDPQTQLLLVKALIPNGDHRFRNAQLIHVRIVFQQLERPLIPVTAVSRLGGTTFAFVAENDGGKIVARQKPVQLGDVVGNDYVVLDGIKPGEQIIVTGVQTLVDGMPVQTES